MLISDLPEEEIPEEFLIKHFERRVSGNRRVMDNHNAEHIPPCTPLAVMASKMMQVEQDIREIQQDNEKLRTAVLAELSEIKSTLSNQKGFFAGAAMVISGLAGVAGLLTGYFKD